MMHVKAMIVDGIWSVIGSANFDNRSFELNDELSVAVADAELAAALTRDFEADIARVEAAHAGRVEEARRPRKVAREVLGLLWGDLSVARFEVRSSVTSCQCNCSPLLNLHFDELNFALQKRQRDCAGCRATTASVPAPARALR